MEYGYFGKASDQQSEFSGSTPDSATFLMSRSERHAYFIVKRIIASSVFSAHPF